MSTLRTFGTKLLGGSLLDWLASGAGVGGTRSFQHRTDATQSPTSAAGDFDDRYRTEREREIELRILMSNFM